VGSNLIVQVKGATVMRVVPLENEAVNECWIADRDRFSYEALNSPSRLTRPRIKHDGQWREVDWNAALRYVADGLKRVKAEFGAAGIGALAHPTSTTEELHLLAKLVRGLGSENVDHRLRHADFAHAAPAGSARWLGTSIASLSSLDRALVIGSFLRKDHPLMAQRLRQAAKRGGQVMRLHAVADDWAMPVAAQMIIKPSGWPQALARVAAAIAEAQGVPAPVSPASRSGASGAGANDEALAQEGAEAIANALLSGERKALLLGNAAAQHAQAGTLLALAQWIAERTGASCGYLGEGGNAVGAQLVRALPGAGGLNAAHMLTQPMKALVLLNVEPELDGADAAATKAAMAGAGLVVSMSPFADANADIADVMLPIAPFTETGGSFVNAEGRLQRFHGGVKPLGETRPGWKVLRVLANLLDLPDFNHETVEDVRAEAIGDPAALGPRLDNRCSATLAAPAPRDSASVMDCERIAEVPIYATDAIVRRAASLQRTADAAAPVVGVPTPLWGALRLKDKVLVHSGEASIILPAREDKSLAEGTVRIAAGHPAFAMLGAMTGVVRLESV
jgi:NADH-quinone oxidoreductase subunit G